MPSTKAHSSLGQPSSKGSKGTSSKPDDKKPKSPKWQCLSIIVFRGDPIDAYRTDTSDSSSSTRTRAPR